MSEKTLSLAEVRQVGLDALHHALGPVGMVRFLQQFEAGSGDYSTDRHGWLPTGDVASIAEMIRERRPAKP